LGRKAWIRGKNREAKFGNRSFDGKESLKQLAVNNMDSKSRVRHLNLAGTAGFRRQRDGWLKDKEHAQTRYWRRN